MIHLNSQEALVIRDTFSNYYLAPNGMWVGDLTSAMLFKFEVAAIEEMNNWSRPQHMTSIGQYVLQKVSMYIQPVDWVDQQRFVELSGLGLVSYNLRHVFEQIDQYLASIHSKHYVPFMHTTLAQDCFGKRNLGPQYVRNLVRCMQSYELMVHIQYPDRVTVEHDIFELAGMWSNSLDGQHEHRVHLIDRGTPMESWSFIDSQETLDLYKLINADCQIFAIPIKEIASKSIFDWTYFY